MDGIEGKGKMIRFEARLLDGRGVERDRFEVRAVSMSAAQYVAACEVKERRALRLLPDVTGPAIHCAHGERSYGIRFTDKGGRFRRWALTLCGLDPVWVWDAAHARWNARGNDYGWAHEMRESGAHVRIQTSAPESAPECECVG